MKKKFGLKLNSTAIAIYTVTALLFVVFAVYMLAFKDNNVYSARQVGSYKTVDNYSEAIIEDSSAPIGIRREYSWQIDKIDNNESCLMFYLVHSYAEVRFDGKLIYRLSTDENTAVCKSPSSNWVIVPLYPSDVGKKVTITVTPVYKSVENRKIEFIIGSRYAVFMHRLKLDLPLIILSALCIIMGILLIIVQMCFVMNKRTSSLDMLYLGIFALLLGIWRITDTRLSPIMFIHHASSLGYISLSALFIMAVPLMLFVYERHADKFRVFPKLTVIATCAVSAFCLVCQVFGIEELRETLVLYHIMLILDIVVLLVISCVDARMGAKDRNTIIFVILIISGSVLDLTYYYINATSQGVVFTIIAFLVYAFYLFTDNILATQRRAYVDVNTRLYNKPHWEELINDSIPPDEPIGVMMIDLNRLKYINDTYGHATGDKIIVKFSEILRDNFSSGEFLCRWGGDEFAGVVRNADRQKMESYASAIYADVEDYNSSGVTPKIYFACGYALSAEFPDISRNKLLTKADERMYINKQQWYDTHSEAD